MIEDLIGTGITMTPLQMGVRAFFVFILALVFIRIAGIRTFGMKSSYDNIIILMLGAILSHAVIGDSPFYSILAACSVIVLMHRLFAILSVHSDWFGKIVKGEKTLLVKNGRVHWENMKDALISHKDLDEAIRLAGHPEEHNEIECAYLERNGHISVIKNEK